MNNDLPRRKNIRLKNYDYSQYGYYFITICINDRKNILSKIVGAGFHACPSQNIHSIIELTDIGKQVEKSILSIPSLFPGVLVHEYIIMPNHLHLIITIANRCNDAKLACEHGNQPLHVIIGRFKSFTTYIYNKMNGTQNMVLWQRNFYEHIIRNEQGLNEIIDYIQKNPFNWAEDEYYIQ